MGGKDPGKKKEVPRGGGGGEWNVELLQYTTQGKASRNAPSPSPSLLFSAPCPYFCIAHSLRSEFCLNANGNACIATFALGLGLQQVHLLCVTNCEDA